MTLQPEEHAGQLSHELDRYLLATSGVPKELPPEDQTELALGVQLIQTDFSHQSKVRSHLRRYLNTERGVQPPSRAHLLVKSAAARRQASIFKNYWYVLLSIVVIFGIWSWNSSTTSARAEENRLQPSPALVVTAVLTASRQPIDADPLPIPTPLAPPSALAGLASSRTPVMQPPPYGISTNSPGLTSP